MRTSAAIAILALTLSASASAWAEGRDPVAAEALFREGRAAADAGNFAAACPKFKVSYALEPTLGTLFNLADCEERIGQLAAAWQHLHQLLDQLPVGDDRRPYVQSHSAQIEPRVPRLRIVLTHAPAKTTVTQDGTPLQDSLLGVSVPIDAGAHHIVVSAPDHADKAYDVMITERDKRDLEVAVGPVLPRPVAPPPVIVKVAPKKSPLRTIGFVVGGIGLVSAATGGVFGALALTDNDKSNASCQGSVCTTQGAVNLHERAKTEALVADITLFGGVALVATGAVFLVLSRRHTEVRVVPAAGPTGAGLSLMGTF